MGIYDRDYYQEEPREGFSPVADRSMATNLVLVTVAVYIVDYIGSPRGIDGPQSWLAEKLACHADTLFQPWLWWQYLSYGFLHDLKSVIHIAGNMFVLWMFGRDVEAVYGRKEFLRLYLVTIVVAGFIWSVVVQLQGAAAATIIGASGAVTAVVILYALNFPHRTILLFFVLPVPAWLVGVLMVFVDLFGMTAQQAGNVAYAAHLAGAAFGFLYFRFKWNLGRVLSSGGSWLQSRPKLKIHRPSAGERALDARVDEILDKINREGEASLTKQERKTLEEASRRFQKRRG